MSQPISIVQTKIMICLTRDGPLIRSVLCELSKVRWTTAKDNLDKLIKNDIVEEYKDPNHSGVGRPKIFYRMKSTKGGNTYV